jgi:hypothetical protein
LAKTIIELIVICCAWLESAGATSANVAMAGSTLLL